MPNLPATSRVDSWLPPVIVMTSMPGILRIASRCLMPKAPCPARPTFMWDEPQTLNRYLTTSNPAPRRPTPAPALPGTPMIDFNAPYGLLIDGGLVQTTARLEVVNPATSEVFATCPAAGAAELDAAVAAARRAFPA